MTQQNGGVSQQYAEYLDNQRIKQEEEAERKRVDSLTEEERKAEHNARLEYIEKQKEQRKKEEEIEKARFKEKVYAYARNWDISAVENFMYTDYKRVNQNKPDPFKLNSIYYMIKMDKNKRYRPFRMKCTKIDGTQTTFCMDDPNFPDDTSCVQLPKANKSQDIWEKTTIGSFMKGKSATNYQPFTMPNYDTLERQYYKSLEDRYYGGKTKRKQCKSKRKGKGNKKRKTRRHSKK